MGVGKKVEKIGLFGKRSRLAGAGSVGEGVGGVGVWGGSVWGVVVAALGKNKKLLSF